jgi:hypothetical protein
MAGQLLSLVLLTATAGVVLYSSSFRFVLQLVVVAALLLFAVAAVAATRTEQAELPTGQPVIVVVVVVATSCLIDVVVSPVVGITNAACSNGKSSLLPFAHSPLRNEQSAATTSRTCTRRRIFVWPKQGVVVSSDTSGSGKEEEPLQLRVAPSVHSTVPVVLIAVVSEDAPPMGRGLSCNNGDGVAAV